MEKLNLHDLEVIKESLTYSRKGIDEYQEHQNYEIKQQQLDRINNVATKVSGIIKTIKGK
jgi:hypothetical protein